MKDSAKSHLTTSTKSKQANDKQIQQLRQELVKEREQHKELQQEYLKLLNNSPPNDQSDKISYDDNIHDISKDISAILERQMHSP